MRSCWLWFHISACNCLACGDFGRAPIAAALHQDPHPLTRITVLAAAQVESLAVSSSNDAPLLVQLPERTWGPRAQLPSEYASSCEHPYGAFYCYKYLAHCVHRGHPHGWSQPVNPCASAHEHSTCTAQVQASVHACLRKSPPTVRWLRWQRS